MVTDIAAAYRLPGSSASAPRCDAIDDQQLAELRRRLGQAVASVCPAWLANDREDLVQIALTKLMENAIRDRTELEFSKTYLRKVAYSHVVDDAVSVLASPRPDPEASSAGSELGVAIRECLAELSPPRRRAVTLWLLGCSHREIGQRMGWNRKRAENLVTRGRDDLREGLASRGFTL